MKLRMTPQREVILREIEKVDSHPTADEIYSMVRKRLPRISLGTVYRNLEILSRLGIISKVEAGGEQKRFDRRTDNHYHARCIGCGRVDDLPLEPQLSMEESTQKMTDYHIMGHRLEFIGLCFECRNNSGEQVNGGAEQEVPEQGTDGEHSARTATLEARGARGFFGITLQRKA